MPKGVSRELLRLLARQRRRSKRRLKVVPVLFALGYVVAELADRPAAGAYVWIYMAIVLVGVPLAYVVVHRVYQGYEGSLRTSWSAWMSAAEGSDSIAEAHDRVVGGEGPWDLVPVLGGTLVLANLAAVSLLWFEAGTAGAVAFAVVVADAVAVAAWTAWHVESLRWARRFDQAVQELYRQGEVGIYGGTRGASPPS